MGFPFLAAIDPGLIIYLIVAVVWTIAKMRQQSRRARERANSPPPPVVRRETEEEPEINEDLKELLETLTGQKIEVPKPKPAAPPPAPPPVPATAPRAHHPPHRSPGPPPARRRPEPARRASAPPPAIARATQGPSESAGRERERSRKRKLEAAVIQAVQPAPRAEVTIRPPPSSVLHFAPTMNQRQLSAASPLIELRDPSRLRKAVLNQLILGPPKAFQP